ncbi:hypothetical protein JS533_005230 [Bifidobacterium amazonense]|uniref:Phage major tail protein n=1 Tax=Bifidobacterium amazonense TaxID=2809027 RepID=A0ABS9VUN8_9BIFI|nr:hypothetical protein [Bifidobacterium amazonense]MCH9275676.1 hypothetical protein [Bifidobacterium amazonense]
MGIPDSQNVSVGKPHGEGGRYAGGMWWAVAGQATVPTDATTALDAKLRDGGYLSEDGVTNTIDSDTSDINAFGGDRVLSVVTSRAENFQFGMIETTEDTLALVYGPDNVTVTGEGAKKVITVKHNGKAGPLLLLVFEFAMTNNRVKRIVVPQGKMGELDDVEYTDGDPITYTPTINALPDTDGNTAYEYIAYVATDADEPTTQSDEPAVFTDATVPSLAKVQETAVKATVKAAKATSRAAKSVAKTVK